MEPPSISSIVSETALLAQLETAVLIAIAVEILLLVASALISSSEVAFFSLGPAEIQEVENDKDETSDRIMELLKDPERLLSTILISNNFVNIAIILISSYIIAEGFDFTGYPVWLGFAVQVVSVTFFLLLLGEVVPKVYATKNALRVCRLMATPLIVIQKIVYPLSILLVTSSNLINSKVKKRSPEYSADELQHALELTKDAQTTPEEEKILHGIIRFGHTDVKQILTPRTEVLAFDYETPYRNLLDELLSQGFSRVPIYRSSLDNVVGILYLKDLLPHADSQELFWQKLLRKPYFVPENKKLDDLMQEFQTKKVHMAIVVDEYGGTTGIVTLEDIIEEIVGDITDEYDDEDIIYSRLDERNYVFEGKTPLVDLYKILDIDGSNFEEAKGESDSLAGFVLEICGRIPPKNEKIRFQDYLFTVEAADKRKVKRVKITLPEEVVLAERKNGHKS